MTPCANQNNPPDIPQRRLCGQKHPAWPTAAGASSGTNVPGTLPSPNLPDKAPGIYETLGPGEMLLPIVQNAGKTAGTASDIASAFAGLLLNPNDHDLQHGIHMGWLSNELNHLCESVGELLACMDIVVAASGYSSRPTDRAEDVRRSYYLQYAVLLDRARQKGLPSDYTSAPLRDAQRKACGLRRPAFIETEKGENT